MRVLTMNLNGVRSAVRRGIKEALAGFDPDLVCLQEVRAAQADIPALGLAHQAHWHPAERPGYSGVGTLIRAAPRAVTIGIGHEQFDKEGRVIRADLDGFTLINVYAPSGTSGEVRQQVKMAFLAVFRQYIGALIAEGRELLICGDMNIAHQPIDLKNWRGNQKNSGFLPEERQWLSDFLGLGLVDVVRQLAGPDFEIYSWWTVRAGARERNVGWRIDYQLATPGLAARARGFEIPRLPVFSDHAPVVVDYE